MTITPPKDEEQTVPSDSADLFNPGGFAVLIGVARTDEVRSWDQSFRLHVGDGGLWVHCCPQEGS